MRIKKSALRKIIREEFLKQGKLLNEKEEDKDLDLGELESLKLPAILKKLLDPDISPAKYADIDQQVDASGNINHQSFAIAAFALSYTDMDDKAAKTVLSKAIALLPKIAKARESKK